MARLLKLKQPEEGYFAHSYLLWFVADNPIRHNRLPANIAGIAGLLIDAIRHTSPESLQQQPDYALGLVCSGSVSRECGVQTELIEVLIDAGAGPDQCV